MGFLNYIQIINDYLWAYIPMLLILLGLYFFITTGGVQFSKLLNVKDIIKDFVKNSKGDTKGINPIKLVFAAAGGMIGIGNIIAPITALKVAGVGSMFWLWVGSLLGMTIKYGEVFLSIKYRRIDSEGDYISGIMFYMEKAFAFLGRIGPVLGIIASISLCIYGIEIFQFAAVVNSIDTLFEGSYNLYITILLLIILIYSSLRGIRFQAEIATILMPIFLIGYIMISIFVIFDHYNKIIPMLCDMFYSAFSLKSVAGGILGSTMMLSMNQGMERSIYSGDIGVGLDAAIQSETSTTPKLQATFATYALFLDTFICFSTMMIVYLTGTYDQFTSFEAFNASCAMYIPYSRYFVTALLLIAGFTTLLSVLNVGIKSSRYLSNHYGKFIYLIIASMMFIFTRDVEAAFLEDIMLLAGGITLTLNILAIFKLRNEIEF